MKPRADQADSDPLPFVQVDRSAHQLAAALSTRLGLPYQHVLGGLVVFWGVNGVPRDLEALIRAGKSEVVLTREELIKRFNFAMGRDLEPTGMDALELLGLVESRADGFRVRGMARFFKPLEKRGRRKASATAAGKASAKARADKYGSAQPQRSADRSTVVRPSFGSRSARRSEAEHQSGGSGTAGERSGERPPNTESRSQIPAPMDLLQPVAQERDGGARAVFDHWQRVMGKPRAVFDRKRKSAVEARLREGRSVDELKKAIDGCARTPHNTGNNERGERYDDLELICRTASQVERFMVNADSPPAARAVRGVIEAVAGSGPIVAREVVL